MKELARMAQELKHEELQEQVAKMTLEGLRICEEHAKECVKLLVDAMLKASNEDLASEAAWALNKLLHRCNSASAWALAAGGLEAVQRCLTFQNSIEDLQCYAWLARSIGGCRGLLGFLEQAPKFFVARLIWVLHDERCWRDQHGEEVPEAPELLKVAARHLLAACKVGDEDVIHAGVALLEDMTTHQHNIAFRLLGDGGGQIFTQILQVFLRGRSEKARATAERCARALGSLARVGRANAKELLVSQGAAEALQAACMAGGAAGEQSASSLVSLLSLRELPGLLGQLTQLEASQAAAKRLRSALAAAERAVHEAEDDQVENIPPIMERLLEIQMTLEQAARFGGCQEKCCDALCSATRRIIWHFQPGQSEVLDKTVGIFVNQMKQVELPGADPKAFKGKLECFESLVDELGKVASACEAWRGELRKLGLEQIITARMPEFLHNRRAMKYATWCAASMVGLPYVVQELRTHSQSEIAVDACFCTIIDILDDDVSGEWLLQHQRLEADVLNASDVSLLMDMVVQSMLLHKEETMLQRRGCHCLALMLRLKHLHLVPQELLCRIIKVALSTIATYSPGSVRDSSYCLRQMLEPQVCRGEDAQKEEQVRTALKLELHRQGAVDLLQQQMKYFLDLEDAYRHSEIFEEIAACLFALNGPLAALNLLVSLVDVDGRVFVRGAGLKAIFEMGRAEAATLQPVAGQILAAVESFLADDPEDSGLRRHAELLGGLCTCLVQGA